MAKCNCESIEHDGDNPTGHKMFADMGEGPFYKAEHVGDVCSDCAGSHMRPYLRDAKAGGHWYTR